MRSDSSITTSAETEMIAMREYIVSLEKAKVADRVAFDQALNEKDAQIAAFLAASNHQDHQAQQQLDRSIDASQVQDQVMQLSTHNQQLQAQICLATQLHQFSALKEMAATAVTQQLLVSNQSDQQKVAHQSHYIHIQEKHHAALRQKVHRYMGHMQDQLHQQEQKHLFAMQTAERLHQMQHQQKTQQFNNALAALNISLQNVTAERDSKLSHITQRDIQIASTQALYQKALLNEIQLTQEKQALASKLQLSEEALRVSLTQADQALSHQQGQLGKVSAAFQKLEGESAELTFIVENLKTELLHLDNQHKIALAEKDKCHAAQLAEITASHKKATEAVKRSQVELKVESYQTKLENTKLRETIKILDTEYREMFEENKHYREDHAADQAVIANLEQQLVLTTRAKEKLVASNDLVTNSLFSVANREVSTILSEAADANVRLIKNQ